MFKFLKQKKSKNQTDAPKKSWGERLKTGLKRTRGQFTDSIADLLLGKKNIDDNLLEEIESRLITADMGIETVQYIMEQLDQRVTRKETALADSIMSTLQEILNEILQPCSKPLQIDCEKKPYVLLMVGVNGAGKTTSVAKLAHYYQQQKKRVMLAAGDTFRAAATEQLQVWGERNDAPVIAQHSGADSASVIYDAIQAAKARDYDLLIADTAGRLHTQSHLMEELKKIKRVIAKIDPQAPHETLLIIDAGIGQNALTQALEFHQALNLTGIAITKLDGTAKGGIIFAIAQQLQLPIRFIGVGEQIDDLRPFDSGAFIQALFT